MASGNGHITWADERAARAQSDLEHLVSEVNGRASGMPPGYGLNPSGPRPTPPGGWGLGANHNTPGGEY